MSSPPSRNTRFTRRCFLKSGATAMAGTAGLGIVPRPLLASLGRAPEAIPPIDDARLKLLAQRAIDAARAAGARYADVRLTHTRERDIVTRRTIPTFGDAESMSVGVRTLVNGYWGFAASSIWSPDEMVRLARDAVALAKTNALGKPREMELAPVGQIRDGHWAMPVKTDLFDVYPPDIVDYIRGIGVQLGRLPEAWRNIGEGSIHSWRQDKAFASSSGSYYTQRTYRSQGSMAVFCRRLGPVSVETEKAGVGFEVFQDVDFMERFRMEIDRMNALVKLPVKPIDVGRYDTVFDASSVVGVLSGSIGAASELDRALGYEANAGGTSYLGEPLEMLGHFQIGSPLLTVTANRTEPGAVATVRWDDEGTESTSFPIVKDGIFVNYQTNREGAGWLAGYDKQRGHPNRSGGCATAPEAVDAPLTHTANLVMKPGTENLGFDELVQTVKKGIAFEGLSMSLDFQQVGGMGSHGIAYEIKDGKRVAILPRGGVLFRAHEFWKNLMMVGGAKSAARACTVSFKGQPQQKHFHSITSLPVLVKDVTVIDYMRKA